MEKGYRKSGMLVKKRIQCETQLRRRKNERNIQEIQMFKMPKEATL